ncbi:MAG TPA: glycosyltransferase [Polyangiaceae bacterium]|nr:glycosyltransferase [Polyangiaceae bacterium]
MSSVPSSPPGSVPAASPAAVSPDAVGVVVIGRNEGERLKRCLRSLLAQGAGPIVYVDSGSTDDSVEFSRSLGVIVVNLDTSIPFTMARGRNAGFAELQRSFPTLRWVQFVDGDCEVRPDWIAKARAAFNERPEVAAVCGRRRERHPEASIYNRLADMEWNGPIGEVEECGGDVLFRSGVFLEVGGFNPRMIAGEEPELCVRVRGAGYKVLRIDEEMTLHDAAITRFSQWWTRSTRSGHSFAEGMAMHGSGESRHNVRHTLSALVYGLGLPALWCGSLFFAASGLFFFPFGLVAVGVPAAYLRAAFGAYRDRRRRKDPRAHAALYAAFCMLGKVPETIGILTYWSNRLRGRYSGLMEYKPAPPISGGVASGNGAGKEAAVVSRDTAPGVSNGASHGPGQVAPGVPANGATEPC